MVPARNIISQETQSNVAKTSNMFLPFTKARMSNAVSILELFKYHDTVYSENLAIFLIAMVPPALRNGLIRVRAQISHMGIFGYNAVSSSLVGFLLVPKIVTRIAPKLTPIMTMSKHKTVSLRMNAARTMQAIGPIWLMTETMDEGMYRVTE
jgi:hypothetical protein